MLGGINEDPGIQVLTSDAVYYVNKQNLRYWTPADPAPGAFSKAPKITSWALFCKSALIGISFFLGERRTV